MSRSTVAVALAILASLIGAAAFVIVRGIREIDSVDGSILFSRDILVQIDEVRGAVAVAELNRRYYVTTRPELEFRIALERDRARLEAALSKLSELVAGAGHREARFKEMKNRTDALMKYYLDWMEAKHSAKEEVTAPQLRANVRRLQAFDDSIAVIRDSESRFLESRTADLNAAIGSVGAAAAALVALAIATPIAAVAASRRSLSAQAGVLRRRESWLDGIVRSVGDALIATDVEGKVLLANPTAQALTGWKADEAKGRAVWEVFPILDETTRRRLESPVAEVLRRGIPAEVGRDTILLEKDGKETPIEATARPIRGDRDEIEGAVLVFRDVSARRLQEAERERLLAEAEEANRAKDRFLAALSHELRTPLNPVLLASSALIEGTLPSEETRPTLEMIRRNVGLEARLIDDLLDISRIVQGKLVLRVEPVDAHDLIREAAGTCRGDIDGAGLRLSVDLEAARSVVLGDPARLQQVVWNLIKNAVKFTPRGGLIAVRSLDGPDGLVIEVEDSGVGIEPAALARIFEPFHQGDLPASRRAGGLGLGLAIGRSVVVAHGGQISASSPGRGRGSTFRVELPTATEVAAQAAGGSADVPKGETAGPLRILLVEDDETTLMLMSRLLRRVGHVTTTVATLDEAIGAYHAGVFDLIISDLDLPDGSGLDLLRQIGPRRAIPAIALTGHGMEDTVRESIDAGFNLHLTKPIDMKALNEAIARVSSDRLRLGPP